MIRFLLLPLAVWVISQTVKFLLRLLQGEPFTLKRILWIYMWGSGSPSTHAAILTVMLSVASKQSGFGPLLGFGLAIALLYLYDQLADRKRFILLEQYLQRSNDESLRQVVRDGALRDISGHSFTEISFGIILGFVIVAILWYWGLV